MPSKANWIQSSRRADGKIYLTWDRYQRLIGVATGLIANMPTRPEQILALGRGSATIAAHLSNLMDIPMRYLGVESYKEDKSHDLRFPQMPEEHEWRRWTAIGQGLLAVDDIWDTGNTFKWIAHNLPEAQTLSLLLREGAYPSAQHYSVTQVPKDGWIVFPWEA